MLAFKALLEAGGGQVAMSWAAPRGATHHLQQRHGLRTWLAAGSSLKEELSLGPGSRQNGEAPKAAPRGVMSATVPTALAEGGQMSSRCSEA